MIKYKKLKNSTIDNAISENYAKIGISNREKKRGVYGTYNGFSLEYCEIGICNSEVKPCGGYFSSCPYHFIKHCEQPRKNTKKYEAFVKEKNLHLVQSCLNKYWDERVERVINEESTTEEQKSVATMLSYKMSDWELKEKSFYHNVIREAYNIKLSRVKQEKNQQKQQEEEEKQVIFEIGKYFYIKILNMPNIKDRDEKTCWYKLSMSDGWVLKENFTKEFYRKLQAMYNPWKSEEYEKNMLLLEKQLEENYGMITMFKLLDE